MDRVPPLGESHAQVVTENHMLRTFVGLHPPSLSQGEVAPSPPFSATSSQYKFQPTSLQPPNSSFFFFLRRTPAEGRCDKNVTSLGWDITFWKQTVSTEPGQFAGMFVPTSSSLPLRKLGSVMLEVKSLQPRSYASAHCILHADF